MIDEVARRVVASNGGNIGVKYYLTRVRRDRYAVERGVDNLWDDVPGLGTTPGEDLGYPTQKTEALLARAIAASTAPGDMVLDCFAGSGTTAAVAHKMGRHWIGCDISYGAIQTTRRRLQRVVQDVGPGFAIYRVDEAATSMHSPRAEVALRRSNEVAGQIDIEVLDYRPAAESRAAIAPGETAQTGSDDWQRWVESIDVDTAYDGQVFRGLYADLPRRWRDRVEGVYAIGGAPDEAVTVAVRITDIFGDECLVTRQV